MEGDPEKKDPGVSGLVLSAAANAGEICEVLVQRVQRRHMLWTCWTKTHKSGWDRGSTMELAGVFTNIWGLHKRLHNGPQ